MTESLIAPSAKARFVVTLPPEPSGIGAQLSALAAQTFLSLTDTKDAFLHLARRARQRLVILTPYIDAVGASWAADLFEATKATDKILVIRGMAQLSECGASGRRLRAAATQLLNYEINNGNDIETFHAKVVLADAVAAYVGSANLLFRSRERNLECGFLLEGDAVGPVAILVNALLSMPIVAASDMPD